MQIMEIKNENFSDYINYIKEHSPNWSEEILFSAEFINFLTEEILKRVYKDEKIDKEWRKYYSLEISAKNHINFYVNNSTISFWTDELMPIHSNNKTVVSIWRYNTHKNDLKDDIYSYINKKIVFHYQTKTIKDFILSLWF